MTPGELEDLYVGGAERERDMRYGMAMITSSILASMGGVKISPEELIGEPAPEERVVGEESQEDKLMKLIAHQARIAEREEQQQAEWLAGLGLAADVSE